MLKYTLTLAILLLTASPTFAQSPQVAAEVQVYRELLTEANGRVAGLSAQLLQVQQENERLKKAIETQERAAKTPAAP